MMSSPVEETNEAHADAPNDSEMVPSPTLRLMASADLPAVAEVHVAAFEGSLLSKLGAPIVQRYYAWQVSDQNTAWAVVAVDGGEIVGFALGGEFSDSLHGFFYRNRLAILLAVLRRPRLLLDPLLWQRWSLMRRVLNRARRRSRSKRAALSLPAAGDAVPVTATSARQARRRSRDVGKPFNILAIATHPERRGRGLGKYLMDAQERAALAWGKSRMVLTVNPGNDAAVAFYRSCGWQLAEQKKPDGSLVMEKNLSLARRPRAALSRELGFAAPGAKPGT